MGDFMPGGGALIPGGEVVLPIGGGGVPFPGGYWVGATATLAVAAMTAAATGLLPCWDGPPVPRMGPANPSGAWG